VAVAPDDQGLSSRRYATLVLRILLDSKGHLVQGTLIHVERGHEASFRGWRGLLASLKDWRTGAAPDEAER
jgi:hypothetical protein